MINPRTQIINESSVQTRERRSIPLKSQRGQSELNGFRPQGLASVLLLNAVHSNRPRNRKERGDKKRVLFYELEFIQIGGRKYYRF